MLLLAVVSIVFIGLSQGYPSGAPPGTCLTFLPQHGAPPQTSRSPYRLEVRNEGDGVKIDLVGGEPFKGFLINARYASDHSRIIPGFFSSRIDSNAQTLDCIGEKNSGVTHSSADDKSAISALWTPPPGMDEDVVFKAVVVKGYDQFWSNVTSLGLRVHGTGAAIRKPKILDGSYEVCGKTEGCFGLPAGCVTKRTCDVLLSYKEEAGAGFSFTMTSTAGEDKYTALGFSKDNLMGDDVVVECFDVGGNLDIRESYNIFGRKANELREVKNVKLVEQRSEDGVHTCKWRQPYEFRTQGATFDLRNKHYMLLAVGNVATNGNKKRHDRTVASASPVDFAAQSIQSGDNIHIWVQGHATAMLLAWLFFAPLGMFIARHFKAVWEDKMPCGVKMWFACHRTFMVLTVLLSIAGVAIMVYRFGLFTPEAGLHPIIGLICVILCIIQPIMALFRCHPGTKNRPIFNWAHWFVGNAAQVTAVVTVFLAVDLPKAGLEDIFWFIYLIMAFVIFTVISHLILQVHGFSVDKKVSSSDVPMQTMSSNGTSMNTQMGGTKDSPGSEFRRVMLGIYIVGLIFIVAAMIAVIWLTGTDIL